MKKLYYTVDFEYYDDGSHNGLRTINVYDIVDNTPKSFAQLECSSEDDFYTNEEEIQNYLDDNGYEEEEFDFIQL